MSTDTRTPLFYGAGCCCVFDKKIAVCPSHGTSVEMLNTNKCLVHTCPQLATGICVECMNGIVKLILLRREDTLPKIFDMIIQSPRYLPSVAREHPTHAYTKLFYDKVIEAIQTRSEFIIEGDRVWSAVEWIKQKIDKKMHGVILYDNIPAALGCTAENVSHFRQAMYCGIEGYMNVGTLGVRKHTPYGCYSSHRLLELLGRESFRGIPIADLYQEDPNMHDFIRQLGNRVVCVNQRVYRCHAHPSYASHFKEDLYHTK